MCSDAVIAPALRWPSASDLRRSNGPALIGAEIDRRLEAARASDPNQQRETDLRHRLIRVRKSIGRLVNAYQEELITIDELRDRTPELRRQEQALHRELQSAVDRAKDRETYLRLEATGGEGSHRRSGHRRVWTRGRARCRPRDRNGAPAGDRRCARSRRRRRGTV